MTDYRAKAGDTASFLIGATIPSGFNERCLEIYVETIEKALQEAAKAERNLLLDYMVKKAFITTQQSYDINNGFLAEGGQAGV